MANDTITAPKGFLAAGVHAGIKASGQPDIGILVCPTGARAAAVFTTNKITSAPVQVSRQHIKSRRIFAVVVNSGNANACTGRQGLKDAMEMCRLAAALLGNKARPDQILVASTGIIGHRLPMDNVVKGIETACGQLAATPSAGLAFSKAIMTTDRKVKLAVRRIVVGGEQVTIAGTIKGAGMIGPRMATTLCFLTTDAAVSSALLARALEAAIDQTVNRLTVDGHQSTNDMAVIMASGLADAPPINRADGAYRRFCRALLELCQDLVVQMGLDAEGATRMFKVVVTGAATRSQAARAARAVADYPLVKCAVHGGDPNWGRIICAVGSAGVDLNPARLSCRLDRIWVFRNGSPCRFDRAAASSVIKRPFHTITISLGVGRQSDFCYGVDLSREYVTINADYHT